MVRNNYYLAKNLLCNPKERQISMGVKQRLTAVLDNCGG
jgi:hypothetical protein